MIRFCVHHRRLVLLLWLVLAAGLVAGAGARPGPAHDDFALPGSESQRAADLLGGRPPEPKGTLVVSGRDPQQVRRAAADLAGRVRAIPGVQATLGQVSGSGTAATDTAATDTAATDTAATDTVATVGLDYPDAATALKIKELGLAAPGMAVELAGTDFADFTPGGVTEGVGLLAAAVILLIAFRSLIAMALPLVVGVVGVVCGVALLTLLRNLVETPGFAVYLTVMLGLGVGIDYALLIVTRFRTSLADGVEVDAAVVTAMRTAGRSVLFAGVTVILTGAGILFLGPLLGGGIALAAGCGVLMVMLAALTLLPALLRMIGSRIDRLSLPVLRRRPRPSDDEWDKAPDDEWDKASDGAKGRATGQDRAAGRGVAAGRTGRGSVAARWSRSVRRRPWAAGAIAFGLLAVLSLPALSLRVGWSDAGNRPVTDTTRRAHDLLARAFGPGAESPLVLVSTREAHRIIPIASPPDGSMPSGSAPDGSKPGGSAPGESGSGREACGEALRAACEQAWHVPGVTRVIPAGGRAALVVPATGAQDQATTDLLHRLRAELPAHVLVTGATAAAADYAAHAQRRLPWTVGAVLLAAFVMLLVMFRSVVVPVKAIVVNLLSIGAAYGVVVALFQWDVLGRGTGGPIDAWVPMMLFVITFGLSMDYEVFLLSRIREEYLRTGDTGRAVGEGLARTATVISAAAAIMFCVFAAFGAFDDRALQIMGVGLAVAVLVDATVVRLVLVPSAMQVLGDRAWWLPAALTLRRKSP